ALAREVGREAQIEPATVRVAGLVDAAVHLLPDLARFLETAEEGQRPDQIAERVEASVVAVFPKEGVIPLAVVVPNGEPVLLGRGVEISGVKRPQSAIRVGAEEVEVVRDARGEVVDARQEAIDHLRIAPREVETADPVQDADRRIDAEAIAGLK